jgi:putative ABC transport system permease protein
LEAIEAIHVGWESGAHVGKTPSPEVLKHRHFEPGQITAMLIGLKSRIQVFALQRAINNYRKEPLTAIMPGVALQELWGMMSVAEQALMTVSVFVVIAGLLGMLSSLLTSLQERRREMAILRAMGAQPKHVFALLMSEASVLTFIGIITGLIGVYGLMFIVAPIIHSHYGIMITPEMLTGHEWQLLGYVQLAGMIIGIVPAVRAYRQSLSDGMTIRI